MTPEIRARVKIDRPFATAGSRVSDPWAISVHVSSAVASPSIPLLLAHGHAEYLSRNDKNSVEILPVTGILQ